VDPPRYPEGGDREKAGEDRPSRAARSKLMMAAVTVVVVVIIALHLTGVVGPGH